MKKNKYLIILILLVILNNLGAQTGVTFYAGMKPLNYRGESIQFYYRDESPAPDDFYTSIDLSDKSVFNLAVNINNMSKKQELYRDYILDLYLGGLFMMDLGGSFGYPYFLNNDKTLTALPLVTAGVGLYRKQLGELINYTTWIQVNDVQFQDYTNVDISISGLYAFLKPAIQVMYDINPDFQIVASIGTMLGFTFRNSIDFGGTDQYGESVVASEPLNDNNVAFYVDYDRTNDVPFKLSGIEFKVGLNVNR